MCPIFLMAVSDVFPGTLGVWIGFFLTGRKEAKTFIISDDLSKTTISSAFLNYMGKDEFLQAIQVLALRFRLYGTFLPCNANAGGSAICIPLDPLSDDEPELTLSSVRERLCLITPHWPQYSKAIRIIMEDFNICEPEKGRFNFGNQTFTDGDTGKGALFHFSPLVVWKLLDLTTHGEIPPPLWLYAHYQGLKCFYQYSYG